MAEDNAISITLFFQNTIRQDITFNDTFLQINNLAYNDVKQITIADIIEFLIANWQPKWGQKPLNISQVRFIQLGRALRTGLAIGNINLSKSSTFHVSMRPMSHKDSSNKRASLLVPTSHNKRTTRTFSNNGQPMTVNTTDDLSFQVNPNGTTTVMGNTNDLTAYYNDRYGLNVVGNRLSSSGNYSNTAGNRGSFMSNSRQRYSYMDPTTGSSSRSYSTSRHYRRYSDDSDKEEADDMDLIDDGNDEILNNLNGMMNNRHLAQFHHIITTDKGRREQEARQREALQKQQQAQQQQQQQQQQQPVNLSQVKQRQMRSNQQSAAKKPQNIPAPGGGGCCIIM